MVFLWMAQTLLFQLAPLHSFCFWNCGLLCQVWPVLASKSVALPSAPFPVESIPGALRVLCLSFRFLPLVEGAQSLHRHLSFHTPLSHHDDYQIALFQTQVWRYQLHQFSPSACTQEFLSLS